MYSIVVSASRSRLGSPVLCILILRSSLASCTFFRFSPQVPLGNQHPQAFNFLLSLHCNAVIVLVGIIVASIKCLHQISLPTTPRPIHAHRHVCIQPTCACLPFRCLPPPPPRHALGSDHKDHFPLPPHRRRLFQPLGQLCKHIRCFWSLGLLHVWDRRLVSVHLPSISTVILKPV